MARKRPTIAEIRANKGKYQYTMMRVTDWDELAAAEAAGMTTAPMAVTIRAVWPRLLKPPVKRNTSATQA